MVGLITYGYVSPQRLSGRKTETSWKVTNNDVKQSEKSDKNNSQRFELRTTEFRDFPTFRLLIESQFFVAAMFAYMKKEKGLSVTDKEQEMALLWKSLKEESLLMQGVPPDYYDTDKAGAAELVAGNEKLREQCRWAVSTYAKNIARVALS